MDPRANRTLDKVLGTENHADLLTKIQPRKAIVKFMAEIGQEFRAGRSKAGKEVIGAGGQDVVEH